MGKLTKEQKWNVGGQKEKRKNKTLTKATERQGK